MNGEIAIRCVSCGILHAFLVSEELCGRCCCVCLQSPSKRARLEDQVRLR